MIWAQFKDPVSGMCLTGTVVASWSLTQEVAGWQFESFYCNDKYFFSLNSANSVKHLGKTPLSNLNSSDTKRTLSTETTHADDVTIYCVP